ncbi:hypothetical protein HMPREF9514_02228 [Enterococcus faecalis TX0855]|nr:hypothetical protein HMPREF9514_02228 [Enterococcus faecalis TX0855]
MNEENVVPIVEKVLLRFSPKLRSSSQLNPDICKKVFLGF